MKTHLYILSIFLTIFFTNFIFSANAQDFKQSKDEISIFPNPINEKGTVQFQLDLISNVQIELFDLSGKRVLEIKKENLAAGEQKIEIGASELKEGIYLCKISTNKWEKAKRMIIKH